MDCRERLQPLPGRTRHSANVNLPVYVGVSDYHSLQTTLSRQSGNFTYLLAYTLSKSQGTVASDFAALDPFEGWQERDYGILATDRTHVLNLSWSLRLPAPVKSGIGKYLVNDWNLSGISTYSSGQPWRPFFSGDIGGDQAANAWYGNAATTPVVAGFGTPGGITPTVHLQSQPRRQPRQWARRSGTSAASASRPSVRRVRTIRPTRSALRGGRSTTSRSSRTSPMGGARRLQLRFGVFNLFNQAYPDMIRNQDIDNHLNTTCNARVDGVPNGAGGTGNVCDPRGGSSSTDNTIDQLRQGHHQAWSPHHGAGCEVVLLIGSVRSV